MLGLMRATGSGVAQKSGGSSAQKNVKACNGERGMNENVSRVHVSCRVRLLFTQICC